MSADFDMKMAYHMGYEDALAKRMPEPSKASVLGRGTCGNVSDFPKYEFVCSACGSTLDIVDEFDNQTVRHADGSFGLRFCPSCGRRVEA